MNATIARLTRLTADPPASGDGPLLDAFLVGDQSAFAALVRRHAGLVFATCRRVLGHQQDAEDAFQATFLVLARRAADVWPRAAVGSWLFGVARRVALKARTVRDRKAVHQRPLRDTESAAAVPPDFDLAEAVHRVIATLPDVYRAAVVACDLEGLSRKDAAERLGWSEGTLSGRLARARELLARRVRRTGLALPAGGLAAVCATPGTAPAALVESTIDLATCASAAVGAPVAVLTEGVVRSMALIKLKAMAAVVFAACAFGFGAFAASGAGSGGAGDQKQTQSQSQGPPAPVATKPADEKPVPPGPRDLGKRKMTDLDRLQGKWQVVGIDEEVADAKGKLVPKPYQFDPAMPADGWVMEFSNSTMTMPYRDATDGWKRRAYKVAIDESKSPRAIDLFDGNKPVGRGVYELSFSTTRCDQCHQHPFAHFDKNAMRPLALDAGRVCGPALTDPVAVPPVAARLALSLDGTRPTKFGGPGVLVFQLQRPEDEPTKLDKQRAEIEARLRKLMAGDEKNKLELLKNELEAKAARLRALRDRERALEAAKEAESRLRAAQAQVELAKAQLAQAQATVDAAQERLAVAEKALADAKKPAPAPAAPATFAVHVRTLAAAEKVLSVKATGTETVLEALVHAAEFVSIKADDVSVWIVRDKVVMPVDLDAILNKGDTKTKYVLKPNDRFFVQEKAKR